MLQLLTQFLLWLDRSPAHFWSFVAVASFLLLASALVAFFYPASARRWNHPLVFGALLGLAIFAFRWPLLFDNRELNNPDESQMLAGAIALQHDPVFWRSVDGNTTGPLDQWPLAALGAFGVRLDYTNARLLALALASATLVFTWLALRVRFDDGLARILILPPAALQIVTPFWDFIQYSSEHVPVALLAAAAWLILAELYPKIRHDRPGRWLLAGVLLGAVPFAKLQGAPAGLWLAVALVFLLFDTTRPLRTRLRSVTFLCAGALLIPVAIFAMVLWHGQWPDFWSAYIVNNYAYGQRFAGGWSHYVDGFLALVRNATGFELYFFPLLGALAAALPWRVHRWSHAESRYNLICFGLLAIAAWSVAAPGRNYTHYLQFIIAPLALAAGALVGAIIHACRAHAHFVFRHLFAPALLALFLGVTLWPQFKFCTYMEYPAFGNYSQTRGRLPRSPEATLLATFTRPEEPIAAWGWTPRFFVEAQRRHAPREAHCALQLFEAPVRDFYRDRYLADFQRTQPPWFFDTTGPGSFAFDDRSKHGHETFPELAALIARDYRLIAESRSARLYARVTAGP